MSGSGFAAPIWGDAMKVVDDDLDNVNFVYPSTVPGAGVTSVAPPKKPDRGNGNDNGGNGNGNGNVATGMATATGTATATAIADPGRPT